MPILRKAETRFASFLLIEVLFVEIDQIRFFIAVVDSGSFTRAGEQVGTTQSNVSQQLRRLEQQCGRVLLTRSPQGIRLTPEGEAFLPYARDIARSIEDAELHLREPPLTGTVRLGLTGDVAGMGLPEILGRFRRLHAAVRLEIETGLSRQLSDRLGRGEFDLVVSKRAHERQHGRVILSEPLVWVGSPDFRHLARQRPLPLALYPRESVSAEAVLASLRHVGIDSVVVLTCTGLAELQAGLMAGLGIGALGQRFVTSQLVALGSEFGLPALPDTEYGLERREGAVSPAVEALARLLNGSH